MRIGLFHGYELSGSGSNEYNRYLAKTLLQQSHTVHIICREKFPDKIDFLDELWDWREDGSKDVTVYRPNLQVKSVLHRIPCGPVYPVYLTDKQRPGDVKAFINLNDDELHTFKQLNEFLLINILKQTQLDVLLANHLVMQPSVAMKACQQAGIPLVIFPHGSAIEYTVKKDQRYYQEAHNVLTQCDGIITGNREVRDRITRLFPDLENSIMQKTQIVGVGVDSTLFTPVPREARTNHLHQLANLLLTKNSTGKRPEMVQALYQQLELGNHRILSETQSQYRHDDVDTDAANKLKNINLDKPLLIFVGALTAGKGLQSLLCALPIVLKSLPTAQLLIIGSGAYREVLEALIYALANKDKVLLTYLAKNGFDLDKNDQTGAWQDVITFIDNPENVQRLFKYSANIDKQVVFLGRMNHEQLSGVFPCADIAVFPSVVPEAYPLVLMESLANGVLPLVSYFSGFKEGIDDLNQFLSAELVEHLKIPIDPAQRIEQLAANIIKLLDITSQQDLSKELSRIARDHYDWHHRAKAMAAALNNVCGNVA